MPVTQLNNEQVNRYKRHLILPEVGTEGQLKLINAKILCIGAGGLGCPISLYLAAAGVGTIGLADVDVVSPSNLQRQVLFGTNDIGEDKVKAAARRLRDLNPDVKLIEHKTIVNSSNVMDLIRDHDIIIDGTDNFPTRYCVNDACVLQKKPNVYGSIFRFEGMVTVFAPHLKNPDTAEGGVLGVICGTVGSLQANETVKLILGLGRPAIGRLTTYSAVDLEFHTYKIRRDPNCPVCGDHPTITAPVDYEQFCGVPILDPKSLEETKQEAHRAKAGPQTAAPASNLDARGLPPGYAYKPDWEITPREVKTLLDKGERFFFVDCRLPNEYQITHIQGTELIPLQHMSQHRDQLEQHRNDKIVVHCKS